MTHPALSRIARACVAGAAFLSSSSALAAVPMISSVTVSNPYTPANTMMYQVIVRVSNHAADADHIATVGFAPDGTDCATGTWTTAPAQQFATTNSKTWILYDFQPGTRYDYKVQVGSGASARTRCGNLGVPRLPASLAAVNLQFDKGAFDTKYVLLDTDDCGTTARAYLVAVDTDTENIVWYLDVAARSTLGGTLQKGWRYESDLGTFLGIVDKRYLYEWGWDGSVLQAKDLASSGQCDDSSATGPCLNHDAYKSDVTGNTYVGLAQQSAVEGSGTDWDDCGTTSVFIDDGYEVLDDTWSVTDRGFMMSDYGYDPLTDGGPNAGDIGCDINTWKPYFDPYGSIDWTHLNSIVASDDGGNEVLDISLKEWDQVVRLDASSGSILWTLSPHTTYSDWGTIRRGTGVTGPVTFAGQHDVHMVSADEMMMLDNLGDPNGARAIRLTLVDGPPRRATLDASWAIVDDAGNRLACDLEGSAQVVPGAGGDTVLATCNDEHVIVELDDPTGAESTPGLAIWLDDTTSGATRFCTSGGPATLAELHGFYRGYPVNAIGDL